ILDEPTSGVDPIARDGFWRLLVEISRRDRVTIFISTHFMNEAERCDRMSMMHAGKVLDSDAPAALVRKLCAATLEEASIVYLVEASGDALTGETGKPGASPVASPVVSPVGAGGAAGQDPAQQAHDHHRRFSVRRLLSYSWREALELRRDPVRATLALVGSIVLLFVIGFGINMDVENLTFAVLDGDQGTVSQSSALERSGSRSCLEKAPITDHAAMDRRMRSGEISLALEIPPGFGRDVLRGDPAQIGAWIDG